jgi:hypothetical protein
MKGYYGLFAAKQVEQVQLDEDIHISPAVQPLLLVVSALQLVLRCTIVRLLESKGTSGRL